jgi:HSP20 family protein
LTVYKSILNFFYRKPIKEVIAMRRGLLVWRPFEELERIRRDFDRLIEEFFAKEEPVERVFAPALDVYETDSEVVVKAELPGVKKEDVEVLIRDNSLIIKGEKKEEREEKTETYHRVERVYGKFERVVALPVDVKLEGIKAEFKDGVLEIRLAKTGGAKVLGVFHTAFKPLQREILKGVRPYKFCDLLNAELCSYEFFPCGCVYAVITGTDNRRRYYTHMHLFYPRLS